MNKKLKKICSLLMCLGMVITMMPARAHASDTQEIETLSVDDRSTPATYTVTLETDGGLGTANPQNLTDGELVSEPAGITKEGFTLDGWYRENTFVTRWNFATDSVNGDITLYAKWIPETFRSLKIMGLDKVTVTTGGGFGTCFERRQKRSCSG